MMLRCCSLLLLLTLAMGGTVRAQAVLTGTVTEAGTSQPLDRVSVVLAGTRFHTSTDTAGTFLFGAVPAGTYTLQALAAGYHPDTLRVHLRAGDTLHVALTLRPVRAPMVSPRDGLTGTLDTLSAGVWASCACVEIAPALAGWPGVDVVRRGALGLDPTVESLAETRVGVYVDDARFFAASPLRSDAPIAYVDPDAVERVVLVRGPAALTLGSGHLAAFHLLPRRVPDAPLRLHLLGGYASNGRVAEGAGGVAGTSGRVAYGLHGALRQGDDYTAGDGTRVPAHFRTRALRGHAGYHLAPGLRLEARGGLYTRADVDMPGILLDVEKEVARDAQLAFRRETPERPIRTVEAAVYWTHLTSRAGNAGRTDRPRTADDLPVVLSLDTRQTTLGGRLAAHIVSDDGLTLDAGMDGYHLRHTGTWRGHDPAGTLLFDETLPPDVRRTNAGFFLLGTVPAFGFTLAGAARLDVFRHDARQPSAFYLANAARRPLAPDRLARTETLPSLAFRVERNRPPWTLAAGLTSVARTADVLERFGDRFPAVAAHTGAEVLGRPNQEPERASEVDLTLQARYPALRLHLRLFARLLSDYTTFLPTDLPARIDTTERILRYRNGEGRFRGVEGQLAYTVSGWTATLQVSSLWGQDVTLDEPAFGIPAGATHFALHYTPPARTFFVRAALHVVDGQIRAARLRGETPTPGYTTVDFRAGFHLRHVASGPFRRITLLLGADNLTDAHVRPHLNARGSGTSSPLPEPGRSFFVRLRFDGDASPLFPDL
ncbi:MAG: ligand-gated channel [Rhodothermaceae bacterium]|nr:MAG: ligand-gated channel [Rhodothermaceae bacterium]